ncbi:hypothetical protein K1T71_006994 [Dendrolimus kikuchii]|uniref:Uncharacterized protein n=1 Tax=Dendrolimus kikuchii TaxID=765133 RepID=A0ACC1CZD1_9NEOP|nr:hypothetical protein K1T71_006994 [Dendrolimus kikuchii]
MLKMSSQIENIVNAYKTLSKIPSVVGGKLNKNASKVSAKWSVRNLDKGKSSKYTTTHILDDKLHVVTESDFATDVSNELLSAVSPRETYKAIIREEKNGKDTKKQYLEVWNKKTLAYCIDLTALDMHGDVYADSEFGSLDWTPDETAVVYVAEKKLQKFEPYIKRKGEEKPKSDGSGENLPKKGEEFLYRQDWGEQLVGKHLSVIVVCNLETEKLSILEGLPHALCPGQVRFSPDGRSVVGVAWETEPRRLGLIFCTNRPSFIFVLTLDGNLRRLSSAGQAVRSPRISPNGDLVWLQRPADGPHHACHQLMIMKNYYMLQDAQPSVIIDIVPTEVKIANDVSFYGLYNQSLPENCFSDDGKRIVFSTPQQNEVRSYVADIDSKRIMDISNKSTPGSTSILDLRSDVLLAVCSSLTTPGQLYIARLPSQGNESTIEWHCISEHVEVPPSVHSSITEYLYLEHKECSDNVRFACVLINYRGSTGSGQASVDFLPKRVGDTDVKDCKLATDEITRLFSVDVNKLCLSGGSHGGFLVTHLSGQYPDTYRVVVSRNPVIDVASMFNSTDIADWCAVEAGFQFTETGPVSDEELLAMRRCSPIAHVHKVKTPTALMLGSGDKRVPHYQGLEYARRLKANGVETRVYMYDDNHSLSSMPAEMDNLINSLDWFFQHLES